MIKSSKYRLYPTLLQSQLLDQHIGAYRFIYNLALETKNYAYTTHRKNISCFELINQLPELKNDCHWLKNICAKSLQQSILDLEGSFKAFYKKQCNYPKFKKKSNKGSFRSPSDSKVKIEFNKIFLPKFSEGIKIIEDRYIEGRIKSTTISKTPTGKYYISILVETGKDNPNPNPILKSSSVGVDLGLKSFIVTSEGKSVDNPKHLKKAMSHLKYLQRQASKKIKGSSNRKKANYKVALQHERITNQRKDFLHKLSTSLIKNHDTICCEDLNITGMMQNHSLAGAIGSVGWGEFVRQLKYKADWYGKNILQIPKFEPSTKICSNCGATNHTLTLADREWFCVPCGTMHDRDINAAINIKNYCLKNYGGGQHRQKSVKLPVVKGALKQKDKFNKTKPSLHALTGH